MAFAHDVPPEFTSELLTTENELISNNTFKTGEYLTMTGLIENNSHERANISMTIFTESREGIPNWQVLSKEPQYRTFEIPPGFTDQAYSITLRALNPGTFHLHIQFTKIDTGDSILSVGHPVRVTGPAISADASNLGEFSVMLDQSISRTLKINSTSEITNFSFDPIMKQISFETSPSNLSGGYAVIPVSELLEGPYYVTLNGQVASSYYTLDRQASIGVQTIILSTSDQTLLLIPLSDESPDQITIRGTQVVPEFGTPAALSIAIGMITLSLLLRYKVK